MSKKIIILMLMVLLSACKAKEEPIVFLASDLPTVELVNEKTQEVETMIRGKEVIQANRQKRVEEGQVRVYIIDENNEKTYYLVSQDAIVNQIEEVCKEKIVTSNMLFNLREEKLGALSDVIALKGEELEIDHVDMEHDFNKQSGLVEGYYVKKDENIYYMPSTFYQEETMDKEKIFCSDYFDRFYGQGYSKKTYVEDITYLTLEKPNYEENPLQVNAHAVHCSMDTFFREEGNILELCANTPIDTVVVEMKNDDGRVIFEADSMKQYLDESHLANAYKVAMKKEDFQKRIQTMKDQGIYVIGRVVTFKDPNFVDQYPSEAITHPDGSLYIHDALPWPSAYSRLCWEYMIDYCKEAAALGINEIQFDYVRFPDGTAGKDLNLKNNYQESKIQAIQGFLYYAREQLHALNTYIAADVFGWNMICGDDENIGQFIPAIATVVDVICPMSYPDHFNSGSFGIQYPWQQPQLLQRTFTAKSMEVLQSVEDPALYRCWIQGYDVLNYRINNAPGNGPRAYGNQEMIAQIQGIQEGGGQGYIVWSVGGYDKWAPRRGGFIE